MKKRKKSQLEWTIYDYKDDGIYESIPQLKALGIYVYRMPCTEDSDMYGYFLSKKKLTKKQIKQLDMEVMFT